MQSLQIALVLLFLGTAALAWIAEPEDFVAAMEENNSQWLQAYSNQNAEVLGSMYAEDAMLIAALQGRATRLDSPLNRVHAQPRTVIMAHAAQS